ncbi:hypothetical protein QW131_00285 [Roseibium salinum]|nr:hypothetical protein [Roseibium salinum]
MDEQTQSFLELTAKDDLVQLVADKRAAWLWSADGARILWANAAGAAFFFRPQCARPCRTDGPGTLPRPPAYRPHCRIRTDGKKFSIDRLRFYRGLRVMLLTCQCKRVELENGEAAALIVCGDKGLSTTKDPVSGFAHFLQGDGSTVFVTTNGVVEEQLGALQAPREPGPAGRPESPLRTAGSRRQLS